MKFSLILVLLTSCATYTNPEGDKLTNYKCERGNNVDVLRSDDYESIRLRLNKDQHVLFSFVSEVGTGYRNPNLIWLTQGKHGKLIEVTKEGVETVLLNDCMVEKKRI